MCVVTMLFKRKKEINNPSTKKKKNKKQNTSVQNSIWHLEGSQELLAECFLNEVSHRAQSLGQHPLHGC